MSVILALLLFGHVPEAHSQTSVSGLIAADQRWSLAGSPYLLNGDVAIQDGATLVIDAGVTIFMAPGASLTVESGTLKAVGTVADPVRVASDKVRQGQPGAPGDWNQWVFNRGATNTELVHVLLEHGSGVAVRGTSAVFNHVDLRSHKGAAITVDLAASLVGSGNVASGNELNGVAVPAGDIDGNVTWGLRGIPYVVQSGVVSVGASPVVTAVTPSTLERDRTVTVTLTGARLEGAVSAVFDRRGLTATPMGAGSSSELSL